MQGVQYSTHVCQKHDTHTLKTRRGQAEVRIHAGSPSARTRMAMNGRLWKTVSPLRDILLEHLETWVGPSMIFEKFAGHSICVFLHQGPSTVLPVASLLCSSSRSEEKPSRAHAGSPQSGDQQPRR